MPNTKQISNKLIFPIVTTILWNLLVVYYFISFDQQLFGDFVRDFGLKGSWNLFTLNMQGTLNNGTIKTYPFTNGPLLVFSLCVIGNIIISTVNMVRLYKYAKTSTNSPIATSNL
jgi:hypothetical protein